MVNENSSEWIDKGLEKGIDLKWLEEDKDKMYEDLDMLGLPRPEVYKFDGADIDHKAFENLFKYVSSDGGSFFVRLIPKTQGDKRPYREGISSVGELFDFFSPYDMTKYRCHLVKWGNLTHTGSIIATDDVPGVPGRCVIEIDSCNGQNFFHGKVTPTHAEVDAVGPRVVRFYPKDPPEDHTRLTARALKLIGGPAHPFPGYYEFGVFDNHVFFRNYQPPNSKYSNLGQINRARQHSGD